jgi:hypothetical protein
MSKHAQLIEEIHLLVHTFQHNSRVMDNGDVGAPNYNSENCSEFRIIDNEGNRYLVQVIDDE